MAYDTCIQCCKLLKSTHFSQIHIISKKELDDLDGIMYLSIYSH